jgi:hypothetical protein
VEWIEADLSRPADLPRALDGARAAYFLVHGMASGGEDYAEEERHAAAAFAREAERARLSRVVYLSGVAPRGVPSKHLASRLAVGEVLRSGRVPALELRASMIVGAGSASWQIVRDLAMRLPAMVLPAWAEFSGEHDKDKNGKLAKDEFPAGVLLDRFTQIDLDKDGFVTPDEWRISEEIFAKAENALFAVRPGGRGDITATHLAWKQARGLPYVPSPLCYDGRVYVIKNGGMASCYDATTGRTLYQEERLGALGDYYSSPVAADGKIYFASQQGVVTVIKAGDIFQILSRNELEEQIMATPAIVDGTIYIRTAGYLFAFGQPSKTEASNIR